MADDYNGRSSDGTFASIRQSGPVIRCASGIDWTVPADPATFLAELQRVAPRFSRGYDLTDFRDMCRDLFPEDVEAITPSYSGSAPIVIVGGLNDPATPFRWAEELTAQMGSNVSLVTFEGEGHGQILSSSCVTDAEASVIRDLQLPAPGTTCQADPPVARPEFWDDLPVPDGVGPVVEDPAVDLALGLPPTQVYADVWNLSGDPAAVSAAYLAAFEELGFDVTEAPSVLDGTTTLVALAPDGTQLVILIIPPDSLGLQPGPGSARRSSPSPDRVSWSSAHSPSCSHATLRTAGRDPAPGSNTGGRVGSTPALAAIVVHRSERARLARRRSSRLTATTPSIMSATTAAHGRPRTRTDTTPPWACRRTVRSRPTSRGGVRKVGAANPNRRAAAASARAAVAKSTVVAAGGATTVRCCGCSGMPSS